jgi:hypothetical protein
VLPELMRAPRHGSWLACSLALLIAAAATAPSFRAAPARASFVPANPPQRALGDFDGDGRLDAALIQDRFGDPHISIRLSGSVAEFRLEAPVTSIVDEDVDHDGDLDLVAATSNGDVLIWLNNGDGHFVREPRRSEQGVSGEEIAQGTWPASMAISLQSQPLTAAPRREVAVVAKEVRPSIACPSCDVRYLIPASPRAPPVDLG